MEPEPNDVVLASPPGPRVALTLEALQRQQPGITPPRVRFRHCGCRARQPGGALSTTPDGGVPRPARGTPEQAPADIVLVMQCSKQRFRNRRAYAVAFRW